LTVSIQLTCSSFGLAGTSSKTVRGQWQSGSVQNSPRTVTVWIGLLALLFSTVCPLMLLIYTTVFDFFPFI
jgi:hypothetical protein